jgi:hypothetical protein
MAFVTDRVTLGSVPLRDLRISLSFEQYPILLLYHPVDEQGSISGRGPQLQNLPPSKHKQNNMCNVRIT